MTTKKEILPTLDPVAFAGALVLAPLLVALLFFWALLIPVFAVAFGAIPYLVFGTPVLLWMVTRYPLQPEPFCLGGLAALAGFAVVLFSVELLQPDVLGSGIEVFVAWGVPFAATWFVAFAKIYGRFYRPARY
jgi:hypothetical protein